MAAKKDRTLLYVAGAAIGGYAAYEFLYKPWAAQRALAGGGGRVLSPTPLTAVPPTALLSAPGIIGYNTLGPQYGGVLGACIAKKGGTWSPQKCQARLDLLTQAARDHKAAIAQLRAAATNPNAAGIPAAQAALAANQAALAGATAHYNAALAAGNGVDAQTWRAAMMTHQNDINDITARISAAQQPISNAAAIAAHEGALAGNDNDYFDLTGVHLLSAV